MIINRPSIPGALLLAADSKQGLRVCYSSVPLKWTTVDHPSYYILYLPLSSITLSLNPYVIHGDWHLSSSPSIPSQLLPLRKGQCPTLFHIFKPKCQISPLPSNPQKELQMPHQLAAAKAGQPAQFPPWWRMLKSRHGSPRRAFPWDRFLSSKAIQPANRLSYAVCRFIWFGEMGLTRYLSVCMCTCVCVYISLCPLSL